MTGSADGWPNPFCACASCTWAKQAGVIRGQTAALVDDTLMLDGREPDLLSQAHNAIRDCIVLHGQVGWSDEMPLQAMLRDVSGCMIGDGTPQIQKLVIARELIGKEVLAR